MSSVPVPYEVLLKRHPVEVQEVINVIRSGRAKSKNTDPATWHWCYQWSTRSTGYRFADLLNGKAAKDRAAHDALTIDEKVAAAVSRSTPAWLRGSPPHTAATASLPGFFPPEGEAQIRAGYEADAAERARIVGLSQEERDAEFRQHLADLSEDKGFFAVSIPQPNRR